MNTPRILQLDMNGQPNQWISWQDAVVYQTKNMISWSLGEVEFVFHGGRNRMSGEQSIIKTSSIIALKGAVGKRQHRPPTLCNRELFQRDQNMCAYCGGKFPDGKLTRDHIVPRSLKGSDTWMNVVTCCAKCNQKKDAHTLEQCGMKLLYIPYVPSRAEHLILANRTVLADQMEFLLAFVPEHSRLKKAVTS